MTIMKWRKPAYRSFTPGMNFPSLMNELLRESLWTEEFANFVPPVNISETKNDFVIALSVPGFRKEDIKVELENDLLTISGELRKEEETKEETFSRKEFGTGAFKRSFSLPEHADGEKITAKHENGVLSLTIAKKQLKAEKGTKLIDIS
jgi:HSP20 family protein